jgi:ribosomal protein L37E
MWDWINCNVLGRHQHVVAADHASMHLLCLRCGHRSNGWQLEERTPGFKPAQPWRRPMVQALPRQHS